MRSVVWFLLGGAAASVLYLLLWIRYRKRQRARLAALTGYLEAASCGKVKTLVPTEDAYSLLEDEIYKTVSELRIAREKAQQERCRQADNLADIAHQLKTPLTSMSLMTQLLAGEAAAEQMEYIERIDNQLTRLEWLTASLLTMSKLDAGAVLFTPICTTFEVLSKQAVGVMRQHLKDRSLTISIQGKTEVICCDLHWTAEVLLNLIKNCSEHTPPEGMITLTADVTPLYQQIMVEDTGTGFIPEELPNLFRRFFRGKNSAKESIGIGLALSRSIVEGQGGILRAENRPQGGASFIIRFYGTTQSPS